MMSSGKICGRRQELNSEPGHLRTLRWRTSRKKKRRRQQPKHDGLPRKKLIGRVSKPFRFLPLSDTVQMCDMSFRTSLVSPLFSDNEINLATGMLSRSRRGASYRFRFEALCKDRAWRSTGKKHLNILEQAVLEDHMWQDEQERNLVLSSLREASGLPSRE